MTILEIKDRPSVQTHITMLQGIITRMANNSSNCKTWAITITSAILVIVVDKESRFKEIYACFIPVLLFFILDCYYLGLERTFIQKQNDFLNKINTGQNYENDIYTISKMPPFCSYFRLTINGILSFSTLPFYGFFLFLIYILSIYLL